MYLRCRCKGALRAPVYVHDKIQCHTAEAAAAAAAAPAAAPATASVSE